MAKASGDLQDALTEVSASSAGGAPFLLAYGVTFIATAVLSLFMAREPAAIIAMFQGGLALPAAFLLERRLGSKRMAAHNPLRPLSAQMAMGQALGIPALIVVYSLNPAAIPVVLAGIGGMHFIPYAWLHRTRLYLGLGGAVAIGAFALQLALGADAFAPILFFVGAVYLVMAPLLYRHAARLVGTTAG